MKTSITTSDDNLSINLVIRVKDLLQSSVPAPDRERGRPKKLTTEDERLFQILLKVGTSIDDICQALNIRRASYFRYKARLQNNNK